MEHLEKQIIKKFFIRWALIFLFVIVMCRLFLLPIRIELIKNELRWIWNYVKEQEFTIGEEEDWIEEFSSNIHIVISEDAFETAYDLRYGERYKRLLAHLQKTIDDFSENPEPVALKKGMAPVVMKGILETEQGTLYLYIYKNTYGIRKETRHLILFLIVGFVLFGGIEFLLLKRILRNTLQFGQVLIRELEELIKGEYSVNISAEFPDNEWIKMQERILSLSGILYQKKATLDNYHYFIMRKKQEGTDWEQMQKTMSSNIAHQLKTPLAIISSQVEMDSMETDPVKREYYCQSIQEEIEKMSFLISGILQESKAVHTLMNIKLRRIHLSDLINNLIPKYEGWLRSNKIRFQYQVEPEIYALADTIQIEHAIHNYMMNAFKHTKEGKMISLCLESQEKMGRITVFNEGDGIAENDLENIWKGYYQGENADFRSDIGLGLSIVKDIVTQHHGTCGGKNVRTGVEFWIELPFPES